MQMPQNTEFKPKNFMPDALAKKVIKAASRCSGLAIAIVTLVAIAPNKAKPAKAATNSFGNRLNNITMLPANKPPMM